MSQKNSKIFYIKKEASEAYPFIIISLSYLRLFNYLQEIETELKKENFLGTVFFDLLGCNGDSSNRFFSAIFDGEKISLSNITVTHDPYLRQCCSKIILEDKINIKKI